MRFLIACLFLFLFIPNTAWGIDLSIPFTPQAPEGIWRQPWQDACEETSIAIVDNFYRRNGEFNVKKAKKEILQIFKIKESKWGKSLDEDSNKITELINNFLSWEARRVQNPTLEEIKNEIDQNQPVIIPVYGKALKNKHFKNSGPNYHMLVISGYDNEKEEFITQEPGTRFGLDFRYSFATIMDALHDFSLQGKITDSPKIAIFTSKNLTDSANLDGDGDGLTKIQEMQYGSVTWLKDSDGDKYLDGEEIKNGFSPTKKFGKL